MVRVVKISIVIPIYNKEKVLKSNIQTVLDQTLTDIEIILVNDGSTDRSNIICEEIKEIDSRVKIIHQENKGVSAARNAGISIATGNYIGFVDPDDTVELNMYESMYNLILNTKAEVCLCNYAIVDKRKRTPILLNTSKDLLNSHEIYETLILNMIASKDKNQPKEGIIGTVWRTLIKRDIIIQHQLSFIEGLPIMEDLLFTVSVLSKINTVCIDNNVHYNYIKNSDSAINQHRENLYELNVLVNKKLTNYLKENNLYIDAIPYLHNRYINTTEKLIINEVKSSDKISSKVMNIKTICKNENLQDALNNIDMNDLNFRKKIVLLSMKHKQAFLLYISYYLLNIKLHFTKKIF